MNKADNIWFNIGLVALGIGIGAMIVLLEIYFIKDGCI